MHDRITELEAENEELKKRIEIGTALHSMMPFGNIYCPSVLGGNYEKARIFLKDIEKMGLGDLLVTSSG